MHETHFSLLFGTQRGLPVDIILGIPHEERTADTNELEHNTRDNFQITFDLASRNLTERGDKQAESYSNVRSYPVF